MPPSERRRIDDRFRAKVRWRHRERNFHVAHIADLAGVAWLGVPPACLEERGDPDTLTANLPPLVAPSEGQVVLRNAPYCEAVTPARPLFVVADVRHLHIEPAVDPSDANKLRMCQLLTYQSGREQSRPAKIAAQIAHISPEGREDSES